MVCARPRSGPGDAVSRRIPGWLSGAVVCGALLALVMAEARRPLRREMEPKLRRDLRNLGVAALSAATLRMLEKPVVEPLSRMVERRRFGLLQWARPPPWLEVPLAAALMDYTLYVWHVLTHRVPILWRLHAVHHADLDLSASTALRFHFMEMAVSVPWRAAQVALLGIGPRALSTWQDFLFASILFHHSNLRLPLRLERRMVRFIVTPRMHGIHHSILEEEANSNWSSGLTIWDRLHGTLRLDVPQDRIIIGLAARRKPAEVTLPRILAMPFRRQSPRLLLSGAHVRVKPDAGRKHEMMF
ncbi:MAG: sterol desaturase family protein [Acetobacteraceae bacterium]|nr:sterol desaturase family protein [Acetobacteraceae bacterium]